MGWDGTGINCYVMGVGQINMTHGQPCFLHHQENSHVTATVAKMLFIGGNAFIHS